jgi:hypothetical protein
VETGAVVRGELSIEDGDGRDFFGVHLGEGWEARLRFSRVAGDGPFRVLIVGPDGTPVTDRVSVDPGGTLYMEIRAKSSGEHLLLVASLDESRGVYGFTIRTISDVNEPNEVPDQATALDPGQRVKGIVYNWYAHLDTDVFSFDAPAGATVTVQFDRIGGQGTMYVHLRLASGATTPAVTLGPGETRRLTESTSATGRQYLVVKGFDDSGDTTRWFEHGSGRYTITVSVTPGGQEPPDETEIDPNDDLVWRALQVLAAVATIVGCVVAILSYMRRT